jgi:hypothetical protein
MTGYGSNHRLPLAVAASEPKQQTPQNGIHHVRRNVQGEFLHLTARSFAIGIVQASNETITNALFQACHAGVAGAGRDRETHHSMSKAALLRRHSAGAGRWEWCLTR